MPYMHRYYVVRRNVRRRSSHAELLYLVLVVAAALGTAYWLSRTVGFDLSGIQTAASFLGVTQTDQHTNVGYIAPATDPANSAPYCAPGQAPRFSAGVSALASQLGDTIGQPVECEHAVAQNGDSIQMTTTGLVAYNSLRNTVSFTDGWRHWATTPDGVVAWEGTDSAPPPG